MRELPNFRDQIHDTVKLPFLALILLIAASACGQKDIPTTDAFTISGKVKAERTVTLKDLSAYPSVEVGDVQITNHKGDARNPANRVKGVLVKDILEKVEFLSESPRELSEFYLTFIATDGYKAVFSWNELFNSETGNHAFIITEIDGKSGAQMDNRIALITPTDFRTGRRYVKGLARIVVGRTE